MAIHSTVSSGKYNSLTKTALLFLYLGASGTCIYPHWGLCWFLFLVAIELQNAKGMGLELISKETTYLHCGAIIRQPSSSFPSSSALQTCYSLWYIAELLISSCNTSKTLLAFYFLGANKSLFSLFSFSCAYIQFTVKLHQYYSDSWGPLHITFCSSAYF